MGLCGMGLNRHIAQRPRDICYILKGKELITKFIFSPRTFAALHPYYLALIRVELKKVIAITVNSFVYYWGWEAVFLSDRLSKQYVVTQP
jgi:hypothetical protein